MKQKPPTKAQLREEVARLRQRVADLEAEGQRREQQQSEHRVRLTRQLAEAEEAERRRLARRLHDQVGQSLTAIGINLDILRALLPETVSAEVRSRLDEAHQLVQQTTHRVRQVMFDLRPELLDDYGLLPALRWSAARFARRLGIEIVVEGQAAEPRLPWPVENVLYRVAQEALTNTAKYAQASRVTLVLEVEPQLVRLTIVDNGVGFVPTTRVIASEAAGWGLRLMTEQIESLKGRFKIESWPGKGTKIVVEVPK
ncbi:MAG TPA: sensor histidine kinase [Anaerolineae bacterium]|nr:sensor histidine kinase [Anaerolineae bacterium]